MDRNLVHQILVQIASGNSTFNTLSSESADALGVPLDKPVTDAEANNFRYHLDELGRQGLIKILFISAANSYTADLTFRGREMLRQLDG